MSERYSGEEGLGWKAPKKETAEVEAPKFREASTVNGIEISVGWDRGYDEYTIYFPQIDINEVSERGVSDQVLGLTGRPEVAKKVYDKAVELAETTPDVYELYKKIDTFSRGLRHEEE